MPSETAIKSKKDQRTIDMSVNKKFYLSSIRGEEAINLKLEIGRSVRNAVVVRV